MHSTLFICSRTHAFWWYGLLEPFGAPGLCVFHVQAFLSTHTAKVLEMTRFKHVITPIFVILEASARLPVWEGPFLKQVSCPPCILLGCFVPVEFVSPPWLYGKSAASWSSVMHVSHQPLIRAQPVKVSVERTVSSCYCQKVRSRAVMSLRWHLAVEGGFVYLFYNDQRLVAGDGKDKRLLCTQCWMLRSGPWMMWGT